MQLPTCPPPYTWWPPTPQGRCELTRTIGAARPTHAPAPRSVPTPGMHGMGAVDSKTVLGGVIVVGVVGLFGWLVWTSIQERKEILKREGSSGLLKYEAGTAAIGVGSALAHRLIDGRARRNPRKKKWRLPAGYVPAQKKSKAEIRRIAEGLRRAFGIDGKKDPTRGGRKKRRRRRR